MNLQDNIDKLPKWAQQEIKILQMRVREAKEEIDRINANEPSNTVVGNNSTFGGSKIVYLNNNQRITFILQHGEIQARVEDDMIEIHAHGEGDLYIKPRVSNSISLSLIKN